MIDAMGDDMVNGINTCRYVPGPQGPQWCGNAGLPQPIPQAMQAG